MSNSIVQQVGGELTVSSEIVAERTDNQHRAVLQLIRSKNAELEAFGTVAFEMRPLPGGGNPVQVAHLNEPQATLLMTFMRNSEVVVAFKLELVKQFYEMRQELAKPVALPSTRELAQMVIEAEDARLVAEQRAIEMEPKATYVDTYVADEDLRLFRNVAKSLGMTEGELRGDLLKRRWIYAEHSSRWSETEVQKVTQTRYSAYADKTRYFTPVPVHEAPRFKGEVMHTLKITPEGAVAIARLYGKHLQAVA